MLNVKKILIPIQGTPLSEATLTTAYLLSKNYGTHLAVLHARPDKKDIIPLTGEGLSGTMIEEVINIAKHESTKRLRVARKIFDNFIDQNNIELTSVQASSAMEGKITASFTSLTGRENDLITYWARLSDITVISHPNSDDDISTSEVLHAILFESGRPVIIAPREKPKTVGKRICIAWNGSAEAASALHTSLRWINSAEKVGILYTADYQGRIANIQDVIDYLKFHGVNAELHQLGNERDVAKNILAACHDFQADMLCMGAYSHPRWKQLILGGVTSYMLDEANLTVLMNR